MLKQLKARYELRNPLALLAMGLADVLCWILVRLWPVASMRSRLSTFDKVLLVNPAHIGDVVISTAAIRRLKKASESVAVGVVVASWAKSSLEGHPGVDRIYVVDHWRLNRAKISVLRKIVRYIQTWWQAQQALLAEGYDAGILLNSYTPNLATLLWCSRIPVRVGYESTGMSPLLNYVLPKPGSNESEQSIQLRLLDRLGLYGISASWLVVPLDSRVRVQSFGLSVPYVVLHPGTGNPAKAWLLERWVTVAKHFRNQGFEVVLTGYGQEEQNMAARICAETLSRNLVGVLTWPDLLAVLGQAKLVVGVDSVVGHVSAALARPFIGIYSGIGAVKRWAPEGVDVAILMKTMPCSPCHTRPCFERPCITAVLPQDVIYAANSVLSPSDANQI